MVINALHLDGIVMCNLFLFEVSSVFDQLDESLDVDSISLHWGDLVQELDLGKLGVSSMSKGKVQSINF